MATVTLTLELPEELSRLLVSELGTASVPEWSLQTIAAEAARQGLVSRRRAAELVGLAPEEWEGFFEQHGLELEYTREAMESDLAVIREVR